MTAMTKEQDSNREMFTWQTERALSAAKVLENRGGGGGQNMDGRWTGTNHGSTQGHAERAN